MLLTGERASVAGEGSNLMVEWSTPTAVALLRMLQHLKQHYKLLGKINGASSEKARVHVAEDEHECTSTSVLTEKNRNLSSSDLMQNGTRVDGRADSASVFQRLSEVALSFRFTGANAFVYGLTPGKNTIHVHVHVGGSFCSEIRCLL